MLSPSPIPYTGTETEANAVLLLCILVWGVILTRMIMNPGRKQTGRLDRSAFLCLRQRTRNIAEITRRQVAIFLSKLYLHLH